jgi:hypothetical protein
MKLQISIFMESLFKVDQSKDSPTALPARAVGRASGIVGFKKFFISETQF